MSKLIKAFFIIVLLIGIIGAGIGYYLYLQLKPVNEHSTNTVEFSIAKGQAVSTIGTRLQQAGLIRQPLLFRLVVLQEKLGNKIQAGSFSLSPAMSTNEIAHQLTKGTDDVKITILEGWRKEEIAEMLDEQKLDNFNKADFLKLVEGEEGLLFPDTYLVQRSATTQSIHDLLRDTFDRKVTNGLEEDIKASGKEFKDIIVMASLIQREAKDPEQMKVVSGILWNRVQLGMALNVDATLQYIKGYNKSQQSWWVEPLAADKESTSAYNTYKNPGLPPRPIDNPGLDAIKAALHPTETDYLYYVHDTKGGVHYAKTLEEHNRNVQQYLR
jgi:UPF0755 protein